MKSAPVFIAEITLPKSKYKFTQTVNFLQAIMNILAVFLVVFDTALDDILADISIKTSTFITFLAVSLTLALYPKLRYA